MADAIKKALELPEATHPTPQLFSLHTPGEVQSKYIRADPLKGPPASFLSYIFLNP